MEEFLFVFGFEIELVVVNVIVYFKIVEDDEGFFDYVFVILNFEVVFEVFVY